MNKKVNIEKYFKPDSRWEIYGISNKEQYAENLVIPGYFHDQVPEDILNAYETVEYLMAHAYYHWPMYDEALHKALLIIEMGIKLKAKQLNIPLYKRKKNGERWYRRLSDLIDDICHENYLSDLKQLLDRSRGLRNLQAHPKQRTFTGTMGGIPRNIKYCVNVLNRLFRNKNWHIRQQKQIEKFEERLDYFKDKFLIAEKGNEKTVINSLLDFDVLDNTLFIVCLPILDVKKVRVDKMQGTLPDPVTYIISNYEFKDDQIIGESPDGDGVILSSTEREDLYEAFNRYQKYMQNISAQDKRIYQDVMGIEVPWHLSNTEYHYLGEADTFYRSS